MLLYVYIGVVDLVLVVVVFAVLGLVGLAVLLALLSRVASAALHVVEVGEVAQLNLALVVVEVVVGCGHVDGPAELVALRLRVDLLDWHVVAFAPRH